MLRLLYFIPVLYGGYFFTSKLYSLYQNWSEKTGSHVIDQIKNKLQLEPHPSGAGAFKQIWKGDRQVLFSEKTRHSGPRSTGTSIYILRVSPSCIHWHKHLSDQAFFWHAGGALNVNGCDVTDQYCEITDSSQNLKAKDHIKLLGLTPLVEGGFYKETYKSDHLSVIYFLLPLGTFSVWHRVLNSDEVWSFHEGCPLAMHLIYTNGTYERIVLGVDGYSVTIPRNTLQAEEPIGDCHSLVGNIVAPPFEWQNFEMPSLRQLIDRFPQHEAIFKQFTRH